MSLLDDRGNFWVPDIVLHSDSHRITLKIIRRGFKGPPGGVPFRWPFTWVRHMRWPYIAAHVINITAEDGGPLRIRKEDYQAKVLLGEISQWVATESTAIERRMSSWVGQEVNIVARPHHHDRHSHGRYSYTQNMQIFSSDWRYEVISLAPGDHTLYQSNLPWNILWDMAEKQELLQSIPLTRHPRTEIPLKDKVKAVKISNALW